MPERPDNKKTYYIAFNTLEMPGKLVAVSVQLSTEIIADLTRLLPINLCEHPLYPELARYVKDNPVEPS